MLDEESKFAFEKKIDFSMESDIVTHIR